MLAVVGIPLFAVVLALRRTAGNVGGDVGIHVPNLPIGTHVSGFEITPQVVVTAGGVTGNGFVKRGFECLSAFAFCCAVVAGRDLSEEND